MAERIYFPCDPGLADISPAADPSALYFVEHRYVHLPQSSHSKSDEVIATGVNEPDKKHLYQQTELVGREITRQSIYSNDTSSVKIEGFVVF